MTRDPITLADEAEEQWLENTRRLLVVASTDPHMNCRSAALARAKIRVDSASFAVLPDEIQSDLLMLYAQAIAASGAMFP